MNIAILLYNGVTALDAIGPYEVLSRLPQAKIHFIAKQAGPIRTDTGFLTLRADYELNDLTQPDVIVVPGALAGWLPATRDHLILDWLKTAHQAAQWTTSVCTGSLILGAAGLLKDKPATTHWETMKLLRWFGANPTEARLVQQGNIITAAGVSAGIDLGLHLANEIAGQAVARSIQLMLEYDPQPPFDSGSVQKAAPAIIEMARRQLRGDFVKWGVRQIRRSLLHHLPSASIGPGSDVVPGTTVNGFAQRRAEGQQG